MKNESETMSERIGDIIDKIIIYAIGIAVLLWLGYIFYAPHATLSVEESTKLDTAIGVTYLEIAAFLPRAKARVQPYRGNNMRIYMKKGEFESVAYPDRAEFVASLGKTWCKNVDSFWFLPSVYIHDIKSGKELASYSCTLRYAALKRRWWD